jgi:K+ transporter
VKYLTFIMRADNQGEGGIFALLALVPERVRHPGALRRDGDRVPALERRSSLLARNARDAARHLNVPPLQVVELGAQIDL